MHVRIGIATALVAAIAAAGLAQQSGVKRPAIVGVAHVALKTNDLAAARNFYNHDLGFAVRELNLTAVFKVNDHQYIEVSQELKEDSEDRLSHICFETRDARGLRDYLASRGVKVPPSLDPGADGDLSFFVADPEGHPIEFVEYVPGSVRSRQSGQSLAPTRISQRIIHAGFMVQDRAAEDRFFKDVLGFRETWHGGMTDERTDWVDLRVPEGTDWLEYMLNVRNPSARTRGIMNHLALGVPSVERAHQVLQDRGAKIQEQPKIGRDGKWQLNLYDPNLTRAELMEPKPVQPPCCSPFVDQ
jgi:catechol 2,3-dioxygenase-like lactoylglutathione lyase family enzyme